MNKPFLCQHWLTIGSKIIASLPQLYLKMRKAHSNLSLRGAVKLLTLGASVTEHTVPTYISPQTLCSEQSVYFIYFIHTLFTVDSI